MKCFLTAVLLTAAGLSQAKSSATELAETALQALRSGTASVPAGAVVETGFSPKRGALELIIKVIDTSRSELNILAYSFTSVPITEALLRARARGVAVSLLVDEGHNVGSQSGRKGKESEGQSRARAALSALVTAGAKVRTTNAFAIHHDKVIVSDYAHVQTGSFNYSQSAAMSNSENVIVLWNNPGLAKVYLKHWERNWSTGAAYQPQY